MAVSPELRAFIQSPDAVDFVTRASDAFFDYVRTSGEVVVAQVLSGRYVLCYVKRENFPKLMDAMGPGFISSAAVVLGLLDRPALEAAGVIQVQNQPYLNLKGRGVLLGFVDTGIDYTQPVFRYEDGSSKIRYLFDQTAEEGETSPPPWPPRLPTRWCPSGTRRATAPSWPRWPPGGASTTSSARPPTGRSSP